MYRHVTLDDLVEVSQLCIPIADKRLKGNYLTFPTAGQGGLPNHLRYSPTVSLCVDHVDLPGQRFASHQLTHANTSERQATIRPVQSVHAGVLGIPVVPLAVTDLCDSPTAQRLVRRLKTGPKHTSFLSWQRPWQARLCSNRSCCRPFNELAWPRQQ